MWGWTLWLGIALALPTPYVETRELVLESSERDPTLQELRSTLASALQDKGIRKLLRQGPDGSVTPVRPAKLTAEESMACLIIISHKKLGAEADLFVTVGEKATPVTVWWNTPREMQLASGPPPDNLFPAGPSASALKKSYAIGELQEVDRTWEPEARGLLDRALGQLSVEERSLINDLPYIRRRAPTAFTKSRINNPADGQLQATYTSDRHGSRIEVYDDAFLTSRRFAGEPGDPQPASLGVLLHEIGHAIAWSSTRRLVETSDAIVAEHKQKGVAFETLSTKRDVKIAEYHRTNSAKTLKEIRQMEEQLHQLQAEGDALAARSDEIAQRVERRKGSPAAIALSKVVAITESPTWYGKTSVEEHFAECFALFHLDPRALERASPLAFKWFSEGRHLKVTQRDLQGTGM